MDFAHRQVFIHRMFSAVALTLLCAVTCPINTHADTLSLELTRGERMPERVVSLNMSIGAHTMTPRAYDRSGQSVDSTAAFTVARFDKPFLQADDQVSLTDAQCSVSGSQISLQDALMDGKIYDILLDWRTATQGFEMIEIR